MSTEKYLIDFDRWLGFEDRRGEEVFVSVVGRIVLFDEIGDVNLALPASLVKALPLLKIDHGDLLVFCSQGSLRRKETNHPQKKKGLSG